MGEYGPPVFFADSERAFVSCIVLRGQAEAKVNDDKTPFPYYRPISYKVVDGANYNILVQVSDPGQNPALHVFPDMIQMWVYWGPQPATPELKGVERLRQGSSETQSQMTDMSDGSPGNSWVFFDETERPYSSCLALRGQVQEMLKRTFPNFKPISYQAQVVKGMNYKIRVDVGDKQQGCLILKTIVVMTVYWDLPPSIPRVTDVKIVNEPPGAYTSAYDKSQKPSGDGAYGETVDFNRDPVSERAYMSAFMLRGQVEEKLNKGKPFSSYRPISYQAEMLWFEGMNFKIRIDVTPPLDWPPWGGIPPVGLFPPQTYVEITVHMGLLPIPELKGAKILEPNSM